MTGANYEILSNGLELITLERHHAPVASIQCWIRAGSLMEVSEDSSAGGFPRGIAHFLEHMTFKGTPTRGVGEISSTVEGWGGEINAYTTFDRTVYYLTVATPFLKDALELLADAIFRSTLDPDEVERERKVILEEISRSLDDPGTRAAQLLFAQAYAGTEAGRPVIGSRETVAAISQQDLRKFRDQFYQPRNCGFVIVGDFETAAVTAVLGRLPPSFASHSGTAESGPSVTGHVLRPVWSNSPWHARIGLGRAQFAVDLVKGDYKQVRFDFAVGAPELEHVDTPALDMCAYLLGGGDLGILNRELRDEKGLVSSGAATLFSPAFPGLFEISLMTSTESALLAIEAAARILATFPLQQGWGAEDLARAKAAVHADKVFRDETVEGLARVGFGITTTQKHKHEEVWIARTKSLAVKDLVDAWRRWITPDRFHIVGVIPDSFPLDPVDVEAAFRRGVNSVAASINRPAPVKRSALSKDQAETFEILPGVSFVYRERPGSGLLSLVLATEGGQRGEFKEGLPPGMFHAMASNLARATSQRDFEECSKIVEGRGAEIAAFSGKDSFGFRTSCLVEDHSVILGLLFEMILAPAIPGLQFASFQREVEDYFRQQADSPSSICIRKLQSAVMGDHPYGHDITGRPESVLQWKPDDVMKAYLGWRDSGPWVIAGCGDLPSEKVCAILAQGLSTFKPMPQRRSFASDFVPVIVKSTRHRIEMAREQVHFATGMPGPGWRSEGRYAVDVLCNILGGTGGRLFASLRDRDALAYSVAPILSYGTNRGLIGAYIACAQDKVDAAERGIWFELEKVAARGVTPAELTRSKSFITGNHLMDLQSGEAQASTMALMELYGIGHDAFSKYPSKIAEVTEADVLHAARRLFDKNLAQTVVVGL